MTETTAGSGAGTGQPEQSTTEQAKEKVQETAQQVQDKAQEMKGQAGDRVRQELDTRSTQAGSQLQFTADAMRRTGKQLRDEEKEGPAKVIDMVAERAERLGNYMTGAKADQIVRDIEDFARRQPWLVAVGGATLGFLASRFTKASSSRRYEEGGARQNGQRYPSTGMAGTPYRSTTESPYRSPALSAGTPTTRDDELAFALEEPLVAGGGSARTPTAPTMPTAPTTPTSPRGTGKGGRSSRSGEPRGN